MIASHLPAWLCKIIGNKALNSFTAEGQKSSLETKWNGDISLDTEEVETQAIIDMDINWLVECDDMSLNTIGSNFIEVEDDFSIGSFLSKCKKKSFNNVLEGFAYKHK